MGRERKSGNDKDGVGTVDPVPNGDLEKADDSDESLHLPVSIFGSEENGILKRSRKEKNEKRLSEAPYINEGASSSNVSVVQEDFSEPPIKKAKTTIDSRFAVYLVRKPIELSTENLQDAHIPIDSCSSREKKVVIGDKVFSIRSTRPSAQMFHIPAEIIHSSQGSGFKGVGSTISGTVVIARAEFDESADFPDGGTFHLFAHTNTRVTPLYDLPLKVIRRKVSRKGIRNLRQRLKANGVKSIGKNSSLADESINV